LRISGVARYKVTEFVTEYYVIYNLLTTHILTHVLYFPSFLLFTIYFHCGNSENVVPTFYTKTPVHRSEGETTNKDEWK
jgi:hypothetical protein